MGITDIFWLFFMFSALQPMLRQRMLEAMRTRKMSQIERQRGSRVILLIHRQETMRLLGFPMARYIDINDSEEVLRAIHMTDADVPLDIVLHTPGGLLLAALQIARAIRAHKAKVTVFVPHYAMSGGTLIALAANEKRAADPIFRASLWRNRVIALGNLGGFTNGALIMAVSGYLPTYVQGAMGGSVLSAGLVLGASSMSWAFASFAAGRLMVRTSYRFVAVIGGLSLVAGSLLLVALEPARALAGPQPALL
jgi:hypothetical protein